MEIRSKILKRTITTLYLACSEDFFYIELHIITILKSKAD
jgi:hypothetical protein